MSKKLWVGVALLAVLSVAGLCVYQPHLTGPCLILAALGAVTMAAFRLL